MKKIPTLFERKFENHKIVDVLPNVAPDLEWVLRGASHYAEAKKLFSNSDIKVVKSQTIDPKVVGYLMEKGAAEKCMDYERRILNEPTD